MAPLEEKEKQALELALDDEYKSWATYNQVIKDFGEVRPFINIRESEARHIEALLRIYRLYELVPPVNNWIDCAPKFSTLNEACNAAWKGEVENVALYDDLLKSTTKADILAVYSALRTASMERHTPAFKRCVDRTNHW
jgi:rubrerythrin